MCTFVNPDHFWNFWYEIAHCTTLFISGFFNAMTKLYFQKWDYIVMHNYYTIKYFKTTFLWNFDSTIILGDPYLLFHTT